MKMRQVGPYLPPRYMSIRGIEDGRKLELAILEYMESRYNAGCASVPYSEIRKMFKAPGQPKDRLRRRMSLLSGAYGHLVETRWGNGWSYSLSRDYVNDYCNREGRY